ncbi:MAG: 2-keto-4-pentenoate hydratase [Pseudomonadota bacterium]
MKPSDNAAAAHTIARAFVDARRSGATLADYPGPMPHDLTTAYRVQDTALTLQSGQVAGWKIGRINPPIDGIGRLSGPIFADQVVAAAAEPVATPVYAGGFAAAEAEFLLRIGTAPDPAKHDYTLAEATALIDAVHVGIEIASSPFPGINSNGPLVTISDFGNNNGIVVGRAIADWRDADLLDWPVSLTINGADTGILTAATMLDGPFGAARFLFEHMARRGIALTQGQWISSGAVSGVHPVAIGDAVVAHFNNAYTVECTIAAR